MSNKRISFVFDNIPVHVLRTLRTLHQAGYEAYLVGGCVRDVLLGVQPKDFDLATSATPEMIKKIFGKRAAIVGRRFRIVHVYAARHIIEITTFRGDYQQGGLSNITIAKNGIIVADNQFGTLEQDAKRRDLTINSLYYDIEKQEIIDFVGGFHDAQKKRMRVIGKAHIRFQEDPVRMLRCIRFSAKLNLQLSKSLRKTIYENSHRLALVSPSRMFDEYVKLTNTGKALEAYTICQSCKIVSLLFPSTQSLINKSNALAIQSKKLIEEALYRTDQRILHNNRVSSFYLIAVLLWPVVRQNIDNHIYAHTTFRAATRHALHEIQRIQIPKRLQSRIYGMWNMQQRLQYPRTSLIDNILEHRDFRAGFDFLQLREDAGELPNQSTSIWWDKAQNATQSQLKTMIANISPVAPHTMTLHMHQSIFTD